MKSAHLKIFKREFFFTFTYDLELPDIFLATSIIEKLER